MPIVDLPDLAGLLPKQGRLLGIDHGSKRVGLAISDRDRLIATPIPALVRGRWAEDCAALVSLIGKEAIVGIVCGLPLAMDGRIGPSAQASRQYLVNLLAAVSLPACLWDERLSTAAVTRQMIDADMSRRRRAAAVDSAAASFILQGALDHLRRAPSPRLPDSEGSAEPNAAENR